MKMNMALTNEQVIDSREVAEMIGTTHFELLRKLDGASDRKGIIEILNENHLEVVNFFIESSYIDLKGEKRKSYLLTKKGCEFIANKFTGEKGIIFTAKYVERFNQMESVIHNNFTGLSKELQAIFAMDQQQQKLDNRLTTLEDTMTINFGEQNDLQNLGKAKAVVCLGGLNSSAYKNRSIRGKVFARVWRDYKDYFNINSYKNTAKKDFNVAKEYINNWSLQGGLLREVEQCNRQIGFSLKMPGQPLTIKFQRGIEQ